MSSTQTLTQRRTESGASPATGGPAKATTVVRGGQRVRRVPASKPSFTVGDIRRAIPAHCFERPLTKSFAYLFGDLLIVGLFLYLSTFIDVAVTNEQFGSTWGPVLRHVLWSVYWVAQGSVMTGLWVIGHECGHRGFADSEFINDAVGLVVHSALLVPYFAWQLSHKRHHSNTGSVEHDEVFVPALATPAQIEAHNKNEAARAASTNNNKLADHDDEGVLKTLGGVVHRLFFITVMLTLGWPAYLAMNVTSNKSYDPTAWVNHFQPSSPIFTTGGPYDSLHQKLILLGDVSLVAVLLGLYKLVQLTSLSTVIYSYFIPYLIVNLFLVLITYLQHTDLQLPHYTDGEWDWLRGALATIDRDYGFLNVVLHHITDTHVVHHLFSQMPHYHAQEATKAVIPLLGDYYRYDDTPITTALWNSYRDCQILFPDEKINGVHWFEPL